MAEQDITDEYLEKLRLKVNRRMYIVYILSAAALLLFFRCFYWMLIDQDDNIILIYLEIGLSSLLSGAGFFLLFAFLLTNRVYNRFNENYKTKYVMQLIREIPGFQDLHYEQKAGFSWDDIRNAAVVGCGNKHEFESEDLLTGSCGNIGFKMSDVITRQWVGGGKKTRLEIIFRGQVICFYQFDDIKISNGHLQIFQKKSQSDIKGWTAEHEIKTENEIFNKNFQIYSTDEHNAFYLLTPLTMEKIMDFSQAVGEQSAVTFCADKMYVAISRTRSMFDARADMPVQEQKKDILEDMELLLKAREILIALQ